jgi:hypothetical protein
MNDYSVKRFLSLFLDMYICLNSNCISACKPQDFVTNFGELTAVSFLLVRLPRHPSAEGFLAMEGDWIPDQVGKDKRGFIELQGKGLTLSERDKVYPATSQNSG